MFMCEYTEVIVESGLAVNRYWYMVY